MAFSKITVQSKDGVSVYRTRSISSVMERHAEDLALDLSQLTNRPNKAGGGSQVIALQFATAVRLAQHFIDDPDPNQTADYLAGWLRLLAFQHPNALVAYPFSCALITDVFNAWRARLTPELSADARERLLIQLDRVKAQLSSKADMSLRILFIGDCLTWDIATQLQIGACAEGYDVEPVLLAKRLGADLRKELHKTRGDAYDLIFYSPFSFGFSEAYAAYTRPRNALKPATDMLVALRENSEEVHRSIELMARHFECPIYVHTVSGITQTEPGWRGRMAELLTRSRRKHVSVMLNNSLSAAIDQTVAATGHPILRVDEAEPLERRRATDLGRILFNAGDLHPTALAQELASGAYARACRVVTRLRARKLVVCDLDNTLWDGVIGDGPVHQYTERQQALLQLKAKGIVLAVASKNDPANIRWNETLLSLEHFVATEINWGLKGPNIRRISEKLNLNPNSFVFLDDRPDERATVSEELPGILALDPNEPETWKMIKEWTDSLGNSALEDRTQLYQERVAREGYLEGNKDSKEELSDAHRKLDLQMELRVATKKDMDRVVELINRTNQFNTTAARTSMAEMTDPTTHRLVLVAHAQDRFGDMGIVGILVITCNEKPEITHFVLSCRVFGFGIENAMIQSALKHFPDQPIYARLVNTPVNGPCREIYSENCFHYNGSLWVSTEPNPNLVPDWLTVIDKTSRID